MEGAVGIRKGGSNQRAFKFFIVWQLFHIIFVILGKDRKL
jgi:hypothetical protein